MTSSRRTWAGRCHTWILKRALPMFDARDITEASDDFDRLRADAWRQSLVAWARGWVRELRALRATMVEERRRLDGARIRSNRDGSPHVRVWLASLAYDTRHAVRGLARDRLLTGFVILTLALGIGANATTVGLEWLLVRGPEQVTDPDRLVRLYRRITKPPAPEQTSPWLPYATYGHLRDGRMPAFEAVGAYGVRDTMVGQGENGRILRVGMTLGAFFHVLGTQPALGRFFSTDEDAASAGPLAILSDGLWRSDFAGNSAAVGRQVLVEGTPHTIVGIAPAGFSGPDLARVDAWILGNTRIAASFNWKVVGRLRPIASVTTASAEAAAVHVRTLDDEPRWIGEASLLAAPIPFDDSARESAQTQMARWMVGVSAIILLITCANVVNLLLVRLARRQRELAIRVALGSGRGRVMRLVALEGLLLALAGGAASVWVAGVAGPVARRALFPNGPGWTSSGVDPRLLVIVAIVVLLTAISIGIVPALHAGGQRVNAALRERTDRGAARSRVRSTLTVVQAALSIVLLADAGLFVRSLAEVSAVDLGSEPDRVIVAEARLDRPPVPADRGAFPEYLEGIAHREHDLYRRVLETVRRLPGVERASITLGLPLDNGRFSISLFVPGLDAIPALPGGGPYISAVARDYFTTMGTRLVRGRAFIDTDRGDSEPVVIVSETTARRLWPGREVIDECVRIGNANARCARVVGVAQDVHRVGLIEEPSLQVYVPFGQEHGFAGARLLVRPASASAVVWPGLRQAILEVDPSIRLVDLHQLSESLGSEMRPLRLGMVTFGSSAALAVLTASLGLFGVMSYAVAWRRREIGIRLALGATDAHIRRLVVGNGMGLAGIGVLIGLGLTLASGRWIQAQLFQTSASDPLVLTAVSVVLLAVALAAGLVPSQRAVRISPTESLRTD